MELNKTHRLGIALAYTLLVFIACLVTIKIHIANNLPNKDKVVHISIYVVYTIVWFAYFNYNKKKIRYNKTILLAFATGILIEILQDTLTKTRNADVYDVIANSIGIAIAIALLKQPKIINALKLKK